MAYKKQTGGPKMYRKDGALPMKSPMKNINNMKAYSKPGDAVQFGDGIKMYGSPNEMEKAPTYMKSPNEMKSSGFKMKSGSPMKTNFGIGASPVKAAKPDYIDIDGDGDKTEPMKDAALQMKSPLEAMGGKFKNVFNEEGDEITTQISDQEYAEIQAKQADIEKQSKALAAERDADMRKSSVAVYEKKVADLLRKNPDYSEVMLHSEGLDSTKYKSIEEAQEALLNMDPKSKEAQDLNNLLAFELSDRGKKMTAEQRRLSMDES